MPLMYQAMKLNNLNFTEEKNEKKGRNRKMTIEDEYEFLMQNNKNTTDEEKKKKRKEILDHRRKRFYYLCVTL